MTDDLTLARETRLRRQGLASPLVGEIVEALVELGGHADREQVADVVAWRRGGPEASPALRRELRLALSLHCAHALGTNLDPAFVQRGQTWSLAPDALAFFSEYMRRRADG
jgi:hypothetical protein